MRPIQILIADDHALFRRGLVELLSCREDMRVIGEAADAKALLAHLVEAAPDLIIMDLNMPGKKGLEVIPQILSALPSVKVLVLTVSDALDDLQEALRAGASGYLLKDVEPDDLLSAIRDLVLGEVPLSPSLVKPALRMFQQGSRKWGTSGRKEGSAAPLSGRELEVLCLVARGKSNREIADVLGISEFTVKNHIKNILVRLQVSNRAQAVMHAVEKGLFPP